MKNSKNLLPDNNLLECPNCFNRILFKAKQLDQYMIWQCTNCGNIYELNMRLDQEFTTEFIPSGMLSTCRLLH